MNMATETEPKEIDVLGTLTLYYPYVDPSG